MTSARPKWRWLASEVVYAVHQEQLAEHGGLAGVRDANALESALARPEHLVNYGAPDVADLAAAYGYGIARNHPFSDGNKRTAFAAMMVFLRRNGVRFAPSSAEATVAILALAAGELSEAALAAWIGDRIK